MNEKKYPDQAGKRGTIKLLHECTISSLGAREEDDTRALEFNFVILLFVEILILLFKQEKDASISSW